MSIEIELYINIKSNDICTTILRRPLKQPSFSLF